MREDIKNRVEEIRQGMIPAGYRNEHYYIFPDEWQLCLFNDKFARLTDKNTENNQNVLTISAKQGLISQDEYYNHSYASEDKSSYHLLINGDFSYNKSYSADYPYGAIKRLDRYDKGIVSPLYICFCKKSETNSDYYLNYFEAGVFDREIYKIAQEGARNHGLLNVSVVEFFGTYLLNPPTSEQEKIAKILNHCDKVIELKEQLIEAERSRKKWLMQNLLDPDSGVHLPRFSGTWIRFPLGKNGKTYGGLTGKMAEDFGSGKPYIPYLNIFQNQIIDDTMFDYVAITSSDKQNRVQYGDVFFTSSSETPEEVGMSAVYLGSDKELYLNSFSFGYRLKSFEELIPEFAGYYFSSTYFKRILYRLAQGATRYNLSKTDLMKQSILIPPSILEQEKIAELLTQTDCKIELLKEELAQWQQKKKALMQLLLTGIVRVSV